MVLSGEVDGDGFVFRERRRRGSKQNVFSWIKTEKPFYLLI